MVKSKKMLSAYSIAFIFLVITGILTWFIPPSVVVTNDAGIKEVVYNATIMNGELLTNIGVQPAGIWDILMASIKGFEKAAKVSIAILVAGAFLEILNSTGALDAGIGMLLKKFTGTSLIAILMLVSALFGSVFGFWEEIPPFTIVVVPLFLKAGYDVITGLSVLFVGATIGNMASVVNPFAVGAAVGAIGNPELSLGSGMILRIVLFIVLYFVGLSLTLRYANKVKKNREESIIYDLPMTNEIHQTKELPELTKERLISIFILVGIILFLILGYMPWYIIELDNGRTLQDVINYPINMIANIPVIGKITGLNHFTPFGDWYFKEFACMFIFGAILLGKINKMSEEKFVKEFVTGAKGLVGVVLVLSIANGLSVLMGDGSSGMSVTFVYWIQSMLEGIPSWAFSLFAVLAYMCIGFFLQSTSGIAGITMPILGAVTMGLFQNSDIGAIGGQAILISAFTLGVNFMSGIYPGAINMGTLELFHVPYNRYLKFLLKIYTPMLIIGTFIIAVSQFLGLV